MQGPDWDLDFLERVFRARNGRDPVTFREDFCSTAALATAWALRGPEHRAWAVDLDPEPLAWARRHRLPLRARGREARDAGARRRARGRRSPAWTWRARSTSRGGCSTAAPTCVAYLRAARAGLKDGGVLVLNAFGGVRAERALIERTRKRGSSAPDGSWVPPFTYVWQQASFNAVDRRLLAWIHFEQKDAPRMRAGVRLRLAHVDAARAA